MEPIRRSVSRMARRSKARLEVIGEGLVPLDSSGKILKSYQKEAFRN